MTYQAGTRGSNGLGGRLEDTAKEAASGLAERGKEAASDMLSTIKEGAESQKTAAADAVANLSARAGEAADDLEQTSPQIANALRKTASAVESAATDIRDKDFDELVHAVADFGRKRPMMLLTMGVLGGVMLGRLFTGGSRS